VKVVEVTRKAGMGKMFEAGAKSSEIKRESAA
jgi:hypothetical protein